MWKFIYLAPIIFFLSSDSTFNTSHFTSEASYVDFSDSIITTNMSITSCSPQELLDLSEGLVYFGRSSCPKCVMLEAYLLHVLNSETTQRKLFYFNSDKWRDNSLFRAVLDQYQIVGVPHIAYIRDAKVTNVLTLSDLDNRETSIQEITRFFLENHAD